MKKKSFMMMIMSACLLLALNAFYMTGCSSGGSTDNGSDATTESTENGNGTENGSGETTTDTADAQKLYEDDCSLCHSLDIVDDSDATTYDEWLTIVKDMQAKTDVISDTDAEEIAQYLADR